MKMQGPIDTPYKDGVVKKPEPGSAAGASFGNALPGEGPKPTGGIMQEVQLSDVGPKPGTKQGQVRIPGGGSY